MPKQLVFDLPARTAQGLNDFFVTPSNAAAMATIEAWKTWPNNKLVLIGDPGTGKTHLTHVWANICGADIIQSNDLETLNIQALSGKSVAVENADLISANPLGEAALFHLHNLVLAEGGALLITGSTAPSRWPLDLPDLRSRLEGTTLARLETPDDMLLSAVLVKLFDDRQINVPANLIDYLLPRMERSLEAAAQLVSQLDEAALSQGRAVTRSFAAQILDKSDPNEP